MSQRADNVDHVSDDMLYTVWSNVTLTLKADEFPKIHLALKSLPRIY